MVCLRGVRSDAHAAEERLTHLQLGHRVAWVASAGKRGGKTWEKVAGEGGGKKMAGKRGESFVQHIAARPSRRNAG